MNKSSNPIFRWIVVGAFCLPLVFFFLPYASMGSFSMSGFDIVKASFGSGFSGVVSGIVQFLIVVGYALLAGVILAIRENAVTYALATFAGASTALMHLSWFCVYIKALGFGLILNLVLFIGGTVFAMINLLLYKNELVANKSASAGYVPQQGYRQQPTYGQQPYNQQPYGQQPYGRQGMNTQSGPLVPPPMPGQPGQPYGGQGTNYQGGPQVPPPMPGQPGQPNQQGQPGQPYRGQGMNYQGGPQVPPPMPEQPGQPNQQGQPGQPYGQQGMNYQSGPQVPPPMPGQPGQPYEQ